MGVNLGNLHLPIRAVDQSPVFTQMIPENRFIDQGTESLHVALVKIRAPQTISYAVLQGVGRTLSQLTRLGLSCVVIIDCEDGHTRDPFETCRVVIEQSDRLVAAIDSRSSKGARRLDSVVRISSVQDDKSLVKVRGPLRITHRSLLMAPLRRGVLPVVAPIGCTSNQTLAPVAADDVVLALARDFAGLQAQPLFEDDPYKVAEMVKSLQKEISLDRIILLDPLGGIPSGDTWHGSHVFVNLEQEYQGIKDDLQASIDPKFGTSFPVGCSIPITKIAESALTPSTSRDTASFPGYRKQILSGQAHIRNLDLLKHTLAILPPSSSAIITTAEEAANSRRNSVQPSQSLGVGTRRHQNPLIHNLFTDKPIISCSLPSNYSLKPVPNALPPKDAPSPATFVKRGMPISIIPDPLSHPWTPPTSLSPSIQLSDPRIDLSRLVHLIEDSFNRKLDVHHYLSRINNRIAGVIIAGEYEGGALLTWENPPAIPNGSLTSMIPYLDKFAVLKRSQGAGGVADIVFKAMVRDCFPGGVCWRSRKDNPVNKWYFERARGTWKMPGTNWTMFWTTEGVEQGQGTFLGYEGVCKGVEPSWADMKGVVD